MQIIVSRSRQLLVSLWPASVWVDGRLLAKIAGGEHLRLFVPDQSRELQVKCGWFASPPQRLSWNARNTAFLVYHSYRWSTFSVLLLGAIASLLTAYWLGVPKDVLRVASLATVAAAFLAAPGDAYLKVAVLRDVGPARGVPV